MVTRQWMAAGIASLTLLGAPSAVAQNGFSLTSAPDAAAGRDGGFLANGRKMTDNILVAHTPQFTFVNVSPRTAFTANYQPEVELFQNNPNLNALNQLGSANFTFRVTARLRFNASDDALTTHDPTRSIHGILIFLPRNDYRQNMAHAAVSYAMSPKNLLTFSFDNVAMAGRVRNAGTVSLAHAFRPKRTITATYSVLNANAQFFGVAYDADFSRDLTVHLSSGLLQDSGRNYLIAGQVEKRLGSIWVNAGYHRFLSIFGTSIQGGVPIGNDLVLPATVNRTDVYQVFSAAVSGKVSNRAGVEIEAAATKSNSGIAGRDINNVSGRLKLDYVITERLKVFTDFQLYSQTDNVFIGAPVDRRRYIAGVMFDISSHPNRVSNVPRQTKPTER